MYAFYKFSKIMRVQIKFDRFAGQAYKVPYNCPQRDMGSLFKTLWTSFDYNHC